MALEDYQCDFVASTVNITFAYGVSRLLNIVILWLAKLPFLFPKGLQTACHCDFVAGQINITIA